MTEAQERDLIVSFMGPPYSFSETWDGVMPVWVKFRDLDFVEDSKEDLKHRDWIDSLFWYLYSSSEPKRFSQRIAHAIKWYNSTKK